MHTQGPALIVHPRTAVRGQPDAIIGAPDAIIGAPPDAIIGSPPDAIIGPSQNYCKIHAEMATTSSQSGHHVPRYGRSQDVMCAHMGPTACVYCISICFLTDMVWPCQDCRVRRGS